MSTGDHRVQKDLKSIKLLIADDDLMTQVIMKNIFKKLGWDSDIVGNGLEVLEKMKRTDYDLILMDVEMPELDGYQTTLKIRNDLTPPVSNIPIIAITAYATDAKLKKCLEVGMDDYMIKPLNAAELRIKIKKMLNKTGDESAFEEPLTDGSGSRPIINLQSLYTACGDPITVKNIIDLFISQTPANTQHLKEFIATEDWESLGKICHKMKASYALIGIPEIKNYLQEMEDDCEKNAINVGKFESYLTAIKKLNAKAIHELESHLENR